MSRRVSATDWAPKGIAGMEPAALVVVKSDQNDLIVAGPGAGKTEMLAQRASFLLETGLCSPPHRILAISFKRDAAKNLKDRVDRRCGPERARRFESYTFDAWAKSLLDRFRLGLPNEFQPTGDYLIDMKLRNSGPLELRLLGIAERAGVTADQVRGLNLPKFYNKWIGSTQIDLAAPVRPGSAWALTRALWENVLLGGRRSVLDFQMIGSLAELILRSNPRLVAALRLSYRYVFLDEFQDTTTNQFALLDTAFTGSQARMTAVGDNKQRIMLWAGAQRDVFEVFQQCFQARRTSLTTNYRSASRLIAIQNHLIEQMEPGTNATMVPPANLTEGGECRLLMFEDDGTEAQYLSNLLSLWIRHEGIAPENICILVRALPAATANVLRPYLVQYGIAARSQDALQDLLAEPLTRLVIDTASVCAFSHAPQNWHDLLRVVLELHGIDEDSESTRKGIRSLSSFVANQRIALDACSNLDELKVWINAILDFVGRSSFIQQHERYLQAEFINQVIQQCAEALFEAKTRCGTWSASISDVLGVGYIPIMSIHKSKGLEYHSVILIGLEDWPFRGLSKGDGEEECAVFVAFSRAQERVIITSVEERQGRSQSRTDVAKFFAVFERAGVLPEEF